jgi:hypothetical protein
MSWVKEDWIMVENMYTPIIARCDETGALLVASVALWGFDDELERVLHWVTLRGKLEGKGDFEGF